MQLVTDDRMAGLEAPDGRTFKPDRHGVIALPEGLAGYGRQAARVCPLFHRYRRQFAGFDAAELERRYVEWEAGEPHPLAPSPARQEGGDAWQ